jgi:hypothetical protein
MVRSMVCIAVAAGVVAAASHAGQISDYPHYDPGQKVSDGYTAEDLRGAGVRGLLGGKIGEVDDLIIGPDRNLRRIVVAVDEGVPEIGERLLAVRWSDVSVGPRNAHGIEYVQVPVTKQSMRKYGVFSDTTASTHGEGREWRATELIGDYINLKQVNRYASVTDLIFDRDGRLRAIAASPDVHGTILRFYTPFSGQDPGWDPGDRYYVVPFTAEELAAIVPRSIGGTS